MHFASHSRDVLQTLTSTDLSNDSFPFGTSQVIQVAGHTLRAIRLTFVGELGWELHIPRDSALDVYKAVMSAGAPHGIINSGYRAIDSLSVEKGKEEKSPQPMERRSNLNSSCMVQPYLSSLVANSCICLSPIFVLSTI